MSRWAFIVLLCLCSAASYAGPAVAVQCKEALSPSNSQTAVKSIAVSSSDSVYKQNYFFISAYIKIIHDYFTENKASREANKLIPSPAPKPQTAVKSWTPDLSTVLGRVKLLISILHRHANFVSLTVIYKRNILEIFSHIPEVITVLGKNAQSLEIGPPQVLSTKYYASEVRYNEVKMQSFRENLKKDLSLVLLIPGGRFIDQVKNLKGQEKATKALFHLLPFLFDAKGNALFKSWDLIAQETFAQKIQNSDPAVWENGYFDVLRVGADQQMQTLAKQGIYRQSIEWYTNFKNQFVAKIVNPVIQPMKSTDGEDSSLSLRELSIESVPAVIALGRGNFGGDCSIVSVPYYSLLKGVTVHYIRKSTDLTKNPDGYVLSVKVKAGNQFVPYFLTVNGATLTKADIEATVALVLQTDPDYKSKLVAFPDWKITPDLVDWEVIRQALRLPHGSKALIQFPDGWETMVKYQNENTSDSELFNYYSESSINEPYIGEFSPNIQMLKGVTKHLQLSAIYSPPRAIEEISKVDRALVAAQAWQEEEITENKQVLDALNVTDLQRQIVTPLMKASPTQGLSLTEYLALQAQFNNFTLKNILALEGKTRGKVLAGLFAESPNLFKKQRANVKAKEALVSYYGGGVHNPLIEYLWNLREFSDADLLTFFATQVQEVGSNHIESYLQLYKIILNASHGAATEVMGFLVQSYLQSVGNDASLGRDLYSVLYSKDAEVQQFKATILKQATDQPALQKRYPILQAYMDIFSHPGKRVKAWLRDPNTKVAHKADFIMTLIGKGEDIFNEYLSQIEANELNGFWHRMDERTTFQAYYKLAREKGLLPYVLSVANLETFLYISENMPSPKNPKTFTMGTLEEGGATPHSVTLTRSVQIAAAPEADILWELVMGKNPSYFAEPAAESKVFPQMNSSNRPVENITWWSMLVYANKKSKLEGLQPVFDFSEVNFKAGTSAEDGTLDITEGDLKVNFTANGYRPLTEAEQEWMIRAGSQSLYPTGDEVAKMPFYAWFNKNSDRTHRIGQLRPNAFGFVDANGNVSEWGYDGYAHYLPQAEVDPQVTRMHAGRVFRGGGWSSDDWGLQSASRFEGSPSERRSNRGARFARTPR